MIVKLIPEGNEVRAFKLAEVIDKISRELNEKGISIVKFEIEEEIIPRDAPSKAVYPREVE